MRNASLGETYRAADPIFARRTDRGAIFARDRVQGADPKFEVIERRASASVEALPGRATLRDGNLHPVPA
jgi:hypothetical protein